MNELLYLGFFFIYTIGILILGKHGFDTDHPKGYFLASRSLPLFSSVASFGATWFSAASILGLPGLIYGSGLSVIWSTGVAWVLGGIGLLFISSKLYAYDIVTVPEFFRVRYNSKLLQIWVGLILCFIYIFYIVIQIRGFGIVVGGMLDIPYTLSVFLIYIFVLYTTFGGLHSVARTDIFHLCLIVLGSILGALFIVHENGGWTNLLGTLHYYEQSGTISSDFLAFFPSEGFSIWVLLSAFFSLSLGVASNPQYMIRILSARSKSVAIRMIVWSSLLVIVIYISILIIGVGSRALEPNLEFTSTDNIYPLVIEYLLQTPWKGLLLISIVAAAISTANSQLLIIASSLVYDIYLPLRKKHVEDPTVLTLARWMIFAFATISLCIAFMPPQGLVMVSGQVWGVVVATLFFPLYGGLFSSVTKDQAIRSLAGGLLTYVVAFFLIPYEIHSIYHPVLPALVISGLLFYMKGKKRP